MPTVYRFEDLELWQLARTLCQQVYPLTCTGAIAKDFRYKDQVRGSSGSIMDNIAEGFGRSSKLEFINSLSIAKGEAEELKSQLYRGLDQQYLTEAMFNDLYQRADLIVRKLATFISYLNRSEIKGKKFFGRDQTLNTKP